MEKEKIILKITGQEEIRPHHIPGSYELEGQSFYLELPDHDPLSLHFGRDQVEYNGVKVPFTAVKCEDSTFFAGFDGKLLLLDAALSRAVLTDGSKLWTNFDQKEPVTAGWETPIRFGAYLTLDVAFGEKEITIAGETWPADYIQYSDTQCLALIASEEGGLVLVLNLDRFVIYTGIGGKILGGGFIKFPEEE